MYADGLLAMQSYLAMRNQQIEIPISRVVNIADMALNYIFSVPCADRNEYDALVYHSVGRDRQLTVITLIVLAAMLRRTEGPQAHDCRAVLMEGRNEDFYDGVSLYERFLENQAQLPNLPEKQVGLSVVENHFPQEDFETDIMNELISLRNETMQLKNKLRRMINQQNIHSTVCNGPVYINATNFYAAQPAEPTVTEPSATTPTPEPATAVFCRITDLAHQEGKALIVENELRSACVSAPKLVRVLRTNEALGYLDTQNLSSRDLYDLLNEHFGLAFKQRNFDHYRSK